MRAPGVHQKDQLALGGGGGERTGEECPLQVLSSLGAAWALAAAIQPSGPLKVRGVGGTGGRHRWKALGVRSISESSGLPACPPELMQDHRRKNKALACALPGSSMSRAQSSWT